MDELTGGRAGGCCPVIVQLFVCGCGSCAGYMAASRCCGGGLEIWFYMRP